MTNFLYKYNYKFYALHSDELAERKEWCTLHVGESVNWDWEWNWEPETSSNFPSVKEEYLRIVDTFYFKSEEDYTWFILRWS